MKKNTILYVLIAFLVIANGFFLFNYLGHKGHKKGGNNFIVKELQFDDSQMQQYGVLKVEHKEQMRTISVAIKGLKDGLFDKISDPNFNESNLDSITTLIANKEKVRDIVVFNYFKAVQKICNEEQKEKFKSIIKEALHKQGRKNRKGSSKY